MAESKVKKGFFFYLMIFLIIVIAFIGVAVVIMLFNPGKNVLGFKYYKNNETYELTATDENVALNLGSTAYSRVEIDAGVADVTLDANTEISKDCIAIVNNTKGFAKSSESNAFTYSVKVEGNVLKVKVTGTKGFLSFSDDIGVIVHIAKRENDITIFKNTVFSVKTTSGNVNIGGSRNDGYSNKIAVGGIDVETESGNIVVTSNANGMSVDGRAKFEYAKDVTLKTNSGTIDLTACSEKEGEVEHNLKVKDPAKMTVEIGKGKLKLGTVSADINLKSNGGTVTATKLSGELNASLRSTIFKVESIDGDFDLSKGNNVMDSNKITVGSVSGTVNIPDGRSSNIEINEIGGLINIHATTGNVKIGSYDTPITTSAFVQTTSGKIDAYFTGSVVLRHLQSEKGNVTANFVTPLENGTKNKFISDNGNVSVNFATDSKVSFRFTNPGDDDLTKFNKSNVSFDILNGQTVSNPLNYNTTQGNGAEITVSTNKKVNLDLIEANKNIEDAGTYLTAIADRVVGNRSFRFDHEFTEFNPTIKYSYFSTSNQSENVITSTLTVGTKSYDAPTTGVFITTDEGLKISVSITISGDKAYIELIIK